MFLCLLTILIIGCLFYVFMKLDANPILKFYEKFFPNTNRLRNKIVWVVGASTGIGESLALQFAELDCKLILTSTTESKLQDVKKKCLQKSKNLKSDDILVVAYDISDFDKNDAAFKQIINKFGKLDLLVNNAARIMFNKVVDDEITQHKNLFDINYFANVYIAELVLRHWVSIGSKGSILVTSSIGAYTDLPFYSAYTGTKKALQGFYRDLAMQHREITVSVILPGPTNTDLGNKSIEIKGTKATFGDEARALMSPDRCAELALIAMANGLSESWIADQPWLLFTYLSNTFQYEFFHLFKFFNVMKVYEKRFKKQD